MCGGNGYHAYTLYWSQAERNVQDNQTHQVSVWAQDAQTGQWVQLSGSPMNIFIPGSLTGSLTASPTSCTIPAGQTFCGTTLSWSAPQSSVARVWVTSGPAGAPEVGNWIDEWPTHSSAAINWIRNGTYQFTLRDGISSAGTALATANVSGANGTSTGPVLSEDFSAFGGILADCSPDHALGGGPADPDQNTQPMNCSSNEGTWHTMTVLNGNYGFYKCAGSTASPGCWTIQNEKMNYIGKKEYLPSTNDSNDGFPLISSLTFDRTKVVSVEAEISTQCMNNGVVDASAPCFTSLNLINNESDYRGLSLMRWPGFASGCLAAYVSAPLTQIPLFSDSGHVTVLAGSTISFRVDYIGSTQDSNVKVKYYLNGKQLRLGAASGADFEDGVTYRAALRANPRAAFYATGSGSAGTAATGQLDNLKVFVTDTERPAVAGGLPGC